jgi:hypothetical protein
MPCVFEKLNDVIAMSVMALFTHFNTQVKCG